MDTKYKILELLKLQSNYMSGEEIGEKFNISRSAVWKNILKLKNEGYIIESITNKGYFLTKTNDVLNPHEIQYELTTKAFGKKFEFFKETDSTNNELKRVAQSKIEEGFLAVAEKQTNGKGRFGNTWTYSNNDNLAFSVLLTPPLSPNDIKTLTLLAGLSVCKALHNLEIDAYLKWPNDIILNGKKIGGILTEISCEIERINYVIVGIGININTKKFDFELENKATSLFIETGKNFKRKVILNYILNEFEQSYYKFIKNNSFVEFKADYEKLCLNIGKHVKSKIKNSVIEGIATGISDEGELIVEDKNNNKTILLSGEVSVRLTDGSYI